MSKISKTNVDRMVWVDIETSGLSLSFCRTLELGVAITTPKGDVIDMNNWVIKPDSLAPVLEHMRPDVREMHTKNLLIDEIGMDHALTMLEAESEAIGFLQQHRVEARHYPMAGSSVHFDRSFLKIDMPALEEMFHYRDIDISSVRELARLRAPSLTDNEPENDERHRVLSDIKDSIKLYKFYQRHFLNVDPKSDR